MAVMGRPILYYGEINRLAYAENVVFAYRAREKVESDGWADWAHKFPYLANILAEAEKLCQL